MKKFLLLFLLLTCLTSNVFAFSFNVDQPGIHIASEAGDSVDGVIVIENTSDEKADFSVTVMDWTINEKSKKLFFPAGTLADSCSSWINISPRNFSLQPGDKQEVKYVVTTPVDVEAGHYSVVFFETKAKSDKNAEVYLSGRIGTIFYHSVKGTEILNTSVSEFNPQLMEDGLVLNYEVKNDGNVYTIIKPSVAVIDLSGKVVQRENLARFGVMPGKPARRLDKLKLDIPHGKYKVLLTTEYGAYYNKDLYNLNESDIEYSGISKVIEEKSINNIDFEKITLIGKRDFAKFFIKVSNKNDKFKNVNCNVKVFDRKGSQIQNLPLASNIPLSPNSTKMFYQKIKGTFDQSMYKVLIELIVDGKKKEKVMYLSVK